MHISIAFANALHDSSGPPVRYNCWASDAEDMADPFKICLAGVMSAAAVRVLAPLCGPLISLAVTGSIPVENPSTIYNAFDLHPLLQALYKVSAATTLQSLSISVTGVCRHPDDCVASKEIKTYLGEMPTLILAGDQVYRRESLPLLHGLSNLTFLSLGGGELLSDDGWRALPPKLKILELQVVCHAPPTDFCLPFLQELLVVESYVGAIEEISLRAPAMTALAIDIVKISPCYAGALSCLKAIMQHPYPQASDQVIPVFNAALHQQPPRYTDCQRAVTPAGCSISKLKLSSSILTQDLPLWEFLAALPVIKSVTGLFIYYSRTDLQGEGLDAHHPPDEGFACLTHLPRVLPGIKKLSITSMQLTDRAVAELSMLTSLRSLKVRNYFQQGVSESQVAAWRLMLPLVVDLDVE